MRSPPATAGTGEERLSSGAYHEIRRRILDNEMPPGTMMLEQELAALLAMSRTPVREALIRLANDGLVEVRPRHGMRVLPVSADDMEEIYEILTALESSAAAAIAERGLGPEEGAALRAAVAQMDAALEAGDLQAWARADERFHATLLDACRNRRLRELVHQFWDRTYRVRMMTLRLRPKPVESNRDHLALIEAIERRDPVAAARVHRAHRVRAGTMLVDLLRRGLAQG